MKRRDRNLRTVFTTRQDSAAIGEDFYQNKYCLAIGINLYEHWSRLDCAVHDALEVARILKENFGFQSTTLINEEATRGGIQENIVDGLRKKALKEDLLVVFFAGHGHTERLPDGRDHGYIVPIEARTTGLSDLISMNQFIDWTSYLACRHILYIFDSCFSGIATLRADPTRGSKDMLQRRARLAITAGGADQQIADGGWSEHSIFTGQLLLGLLGAADRDENDTITATELFAYLATEVPKSATQTPALGCLPGHEGGDIFFPSQQGKVKSLPIAMDPVTKYNIAPYFQTGYMSRSRGLLQKATSDPVGEGVSLFAEDQQQWAIIIGTNPKQILHLTGDPATILPTEFLDAFDVLDWFHNPDAYGAIPPERLFCWMSERADHENVYTGLEQIRKKIGPGDTLLFYFSGHATEFSKPGEILLYDAFDEAEWGVVTPETRGIIRATWLVKWCNRLPARKVVCILDSGGPPFYKASKALGPGRYILSSLNSTTLGRNGFITWYVRRAVQKLGRKTTIALLAQILEQADEYRREKKDEPLHVYLRGRDR